MVGLAVTVGVTVRVKGGTVVVGVGEYIGVLVAEGVGE
jgi:hypothetical protein